MTSHPTFQYITPTGLQQSILLADILSTTVGVDLDRRHPGESRTIKMLGNVARSLRAATPDPMIDGPLRSFDRFDGALVSVLGWWLLEDLLDVQLSMSEIRVRWVSEEYW